MFGADRLRKSAARIDESGSGEKEMRCKYDKRRDLNTERKMGIVALGGQRAREAMEDKGEICAGCWEWTKMFGNPQSSEENLQ